MKQLILDLIPPPMPTLANFVVGENAEVVSRLHEFVAAPAAAERSGVYYLWGPHGSGKTHLAAAVASGIGAPILTALDGAITMLPVAVVDNVQRLDEASLQGLFNLINLQKEAGGSVLATGDAAPRDLAIRRDLASRLGSGLVFHLKSLSDDQKAEALRAHARTRGFALRDDVILYLLRHSRREMSSLVSMLDALDHYSIESGREITLPLLREIMQPSLA